LKSKLLSTASGGRLRVLSPAKVNLYLRVLGKRSDGFHELETLFERVSLCDEVILEKAPSGVSLVGNAYGLPRDEKNLACRAALLFRERLGVTKGVRIRLKKRIPTEAGLGGGSSNAASVLIGLNRLWRLGLSRPALVRLGAEIGSDVAFFCLDRPYAIGRGRGEKLRALPGKKPEIWHVLVKPPFGISTREAYGSLGASSLTPPKADAILLLHSVRKSDSERVSQLLFNSLEVTLTHRVGTIRKIKEELVRSGALGALLSGSGSTVFGIFSSKRQAVRAARGIRQVHRDWKTFVVSTF